MQVDLSGTVQLFPQVVFPQKIPNGFPLFQVSQQLFKSQMGKSLLNVFRHYGVPRIFI